MARSARWRRPVVVGEPTLRAAAIATVVAGAACCAVAVRLEGNPAVATGVSPSWLVSLAVVAAAGLTVAWIRPRNIIGWLLLLPVLLQALSLATAAYAEAQYATPHPGPGSFLAASLAEWTWFPSLVLPVAVLPSVYPSGRAETRLRRLFVLAGLLGTAGICLELALVLGPTDLVPGLRLPWTAPDWVSGVIVVPSALALAVSVLGGLVAAFVRMLRSTAPERQQLIWLLAALAPSCIEYFYSLPDAGLGYAFFGVAVAVGVLRYRLLDIHLVIRRALFYVPLVALVALVVASVSTAVARLAPSGPIPLLGAAAVVAVLVGPVTGWLRRTVDRFVLGDRADPLSALGRVTAHGGLATTDGGLSSLLSALVEAVQVPYAAVVDARGRTLAAAGHEMAGADEVELRGSGEHLGVLRLAPPSDEPGRRIVAVLAPHLATLVRTQRLASEVEEQRRRVDAATQEERERIRSDLHDSLGPSLSGIALGLQAVEVALEGDEPAARSLLRQSRELAQAAVLDVRHALDALGPPALDPQRMDAAVRRAADVLGFDGAHGPSFRCDMGVDRLPPDLAEVAFRIIGEALHNVARHARATACEVSLTPGDGSVRVRIRDDGVGMHDAGHGVGLTSMQRRARSTGGTFTITSRADSGGTVVDVELPLAGRA
ncbi:histidine kinase [Nocardioides sp. MAHUQ-72]|uniref:sensor histidine kinase n=1 Tax=unclassified Nocardioides TaxID=2615069 RepID=UPI003615D1BB